jgi:hypothetical protein
MRLKSQTYQQLWTTEMILKANQTWVNIKERNRISSRFDEGSSQFFKPNEAG